MDKTFTFTLLLDEYVDFLSFMTGSSKRMRGLRWFLLTSIPAILVTGVLLLRIRQWLVIACAFLIAVMWVMYGARAVWKRYIRRRIKHDLIKKANVTSFREMTYHFTDRGIEYENNGKPVCLKYNDLTMIPFGSGLAFATKSEAVIIPYRVFKDNDERDEFIKEYMKYTGRSSAGQ